jgi:hypothetical protein
MTDEYVALTLRLPRELHETLRRFGFYSRTPVTRLVIAALQDAVDNGKFNSEIGE